MILLSQGDQDTAAYVKNSYHEILPLGPSINSNRDEVAPHRYATKLYFSRLPSTGAAGMKPGRAMSAIESGHVIPNDINPSDENLNAAYTALTVTGQRIYYTLFQQDGLGKINKSQIWFRDKDFQGKWGPARQMPKWFSQNGNKVSQPATGILRDTRSDILFFVSENAEGKGKQDIWATYVEKDGSFSPPINLPFNTSQDESAPFFDIGSQTLYFSSKNQPSYGGYDIFRADYLGSGKWSKPENLGQPINSYYDDLFFTFNDNGHQCYFSSNRPKANCPPADPMCRDFDLYRVNLKANLQVFLFDDYDKSPLFGCNVELKDMATGEILSTYLNLKDNFASVGLEPGKAYQLIISKPGYRAEYEEVSADGLDFFKTAFLELRLKPLKIQAAKVPKVDIRPAELVAVHAVIEAPEALPKHEIPFEPEIKNDTAVIAYAEPVAHKNSPAAEEVLQKGGGEEMPQPDLEMERAKGVAESRVEEETQPLAPLAEVELDTNTSLAIMVENPVKTDDTPLEIKNIETTAEPFLEKKKAQEQTETVSEIIPAKQPLEIIPPVSPPTETDKTNVPEEILGTTGKFISRTKALFWELDSINYLPVTNMPQIFLGKNEDPVDLLFYHKGLQCQVAFDFKNKDFQPDGTGTMDRYLKSIDGLLKKNQEPPIGITFFHGKESQFVVYSFMDGNAKTDGPSFIHTFLFPEHYKGVLPDPAAFIRLGE